MGQSDKVRRAIDTGDNFWGVISAVMAVFLYVGGIVDPSHPEAAALRIFLFLVIGSVAFVVLADNFEGTGARIVQVVIGAPIATFAFVLLFTPNPDTQEATKTWLPYLSVGFRPWGVLSVIVGIAVVKLTRQNLEKLVGALFLLVGVGFLYYEQSHSIDFIRAVVLAPTQFGAFGPSGICWRFRA